MKSVNRGKKQDAFREQIISVFTPSLLVSVSVLFTNNPPSTVAAQGTIPRENITQRTKTYSCHIVIS